MNFNSHAHVERDIIGANPEEIFAISTHTLTWSVTVPILGLTNAQNISTHTLTWSVTTGKRHYIQNPVISTHTLTWSVTCHC